MVRSDSHFAHLSTNWTCPRHAHLRPDTHTSECCHRSPTMVMYHFTKLRVRLLARRVAGAPSPPQHFPLPTAGCRSLTLLTRSRPRVEQRETTLRYPTSTSGIHTMLPQNVPWLQSTESSTSASTQTNANTTTLKATCQCGSISFTLHRAHLQAIYHCHCNQCQKQSASAFGTASSFPPLTCSLSRPHLRGKCDAGHGQPKKEGKWIVTFAKNVGCE